MVSPLGQDMRFCPRRSSFVSSRPYYIAEKWILNVLFAKKHILSGHKTFNYIRENVRE